MLLLGIDGGGTKTDMVLCNEAGTVYRRVIGGPTNPSGVTEQKLRQTLRDMLAVLLENFGGLPAAVDCCFAGISGCGLAENEHAMREILIALLPQVRRIHCGSDSVNALNSGAGRRDGMAAIAGTGSTVVARTSDTYRQTGGWGYLLGDEGSGYALGRMALAAALRAFDGRGEPTLLTRLCADKLGAPVQACIPRIYSGGRTLIASFAPCLTEAASQGDSAAVMLLEEAALDLSTLIRTAAIHNPAPVTVVLVGSVWENGGLLEKMVKSRLGGGYRLVYPAHPPIYGAVLEAVYRAGLQVTEAFEAHFAQSIINGEIHV